MAINALWKFRKIYSTPYVSNTQIPVELTKYIQVDFLRRLIVQVSGTIATGTGGAGAVTGRTNPEDLLISAILQSSPTVANVIPVNAVSGRGLFVDNAVNRRRFIKAAPINDNQAGNQTVNICYELLFRRNGLRKAVEYGFDISRYTGALLLLTFGDQTRLVTGSSNTWPLNNLTISIFADSDFTVNPDQIHAHEIFEQNFPILQTQPDFLINQLPSGYIYTDLYFLTEQNNILTPGILTNIDIEGGGRVWMQLGDNNADVMQRVLTLDNFDGTVVTNDDPRISTYYANNAAHTVFVGPLVSSTTTTLPLPAPLTVDDGIYVLKMRDGMFTRNIDALTAQIIIKLGVNFISGVQNLRLVGRRMIPGAVYKKAAAAAAKK